MPEIGQLPGNGAAWGNIYNTNMPQTDEAANQAASLQGQQLLQQQRELQAQKAAKLKDAQDQQDKINANVRGADVPLVNQKYNDFREASMDLEANKKKLPREVYLDRQQQVNQKLADVTKLIADSTQGKAQDAEDIKNQSDPSKSFDYNDNAHNILNQRVNTPINQWSAAPVLDANGKQVMDENGKPKTQDLSDPSLVKYKAKEDFLPLIQTAVGKSEKLNGGIPIGNQGGINRTTKDYTGSNSAYGIANTLSTSLQSDDKKGGLKAVERQADLLHQYGNVSDADMAATDKQYNEQYLINPDVKAAYGLTGKEVFPDTGNAKIDKIVKYISQKQAMLPDNMPKGETKISTNEAAKTETEFNHQVKLKGMDADQQTRSVGAVIDDLKTNGVDVRDGSITGMGNTTGVKVLNPSPPILTALSKKVVAKQPKGATDDDKNDISGQPVIDKDGKIVISDLPPSKLTYDQKSDSYTVEYPDGSKNTLSENQLRGVISSSKAYDTKSKIEQINAPATIVTKKGGSSSSNSTIGKQYKLNNKTFSQSQVEKAAAASGMSVNDYIKQAGLQ